MDVLACLRQLADRLYLPNCVLCGGSASGSPGDCLDLCRHCYQQLPLNSSACRLCALPLPEHSTVDAVCGRCLKKAPAFDYSLSILLYEQPVVWLVQQLKFNQCLTHSRLLGEVMRDQVIDRIQCEEDPPQCLLPVPLSSQRQRERGFNQSIELARPLAKAIDLPLVCDIAQRTRHTERQTGLDAKQRHQNLRGAFALIKPLHYEHVLIVDDVVTTGATVNELARVLKRAGVKRVGVLSVARAPMK